MAVFEKPSSAAGRPIFASDQLRIAVLREDQTFQA